MHLLSQQFPLFKQEIGTLVKQDIHLIANGFIAEYFKTKTIKIQ